MTRADVIGHKAWLGLIVGIVLMALGIRLVGLNGAGETWDEVAYYDAGRTYLQNVRDGRWEAADWNGNFEHPPVAKWLLGIASLEAYQDHQTDYGGGRLLSAVLGSVTVLLTMLIAARLYDRRVAFLSGAVLALLPIVIGLNRVYGLDTPTTFFFVLTTWLMLVGLQAKQPARWWILAAVSLGLAMGTRLSNLLLYPFLVTVVLLLRWPIWHRRRQLHELWWVGAFALIPPLVFFVSWPWLWQDTLAHLQLTLGHWSPIASFMLGEHRVWGPEYFLIFFLVTTPVLILGLLVVFIMRTLMRGRVADWLVLSWIGWVALFAFYSLRQGGIRYLLPLMPAVAMASAVALSRLADRLRAARAFAGLAVGLILYLLVTAFWNQPYQLDYFNELVGGTSTVGRTQQFQLSWWGEGVESAVVWLNATAPEGASVTFRAIPDRAQRLLRSDFIRLDDGEFVVTNWSDRYLKGGFDPSQAGYRLVHTVETRGAILAEVWQRQ